MFQELFFLSHLVLTISSLLAVFCLLTGRAAAMSSRNILLFLGFGLHLAIVLGLIAPSSEVNTVFEDMLEIVHRLNGGTDEHP